MFETEIGEIKNAFNRLEHYMKWQVHYLKEISERLDGERKHEEPKAEN